MTDQTPEPWHAAHALGRADLLLDGERISADRVKACVNACAGIPTEQLEPGNLATVLQTLRHIEGGHFEGAGEMAVAGEWKRFSMRLQKLARAALASFRKDKP